MILPSLGAFLFLDGLSGAESSRLAQTVERLGYGVLWIVEAMGHDSCPTCGRSRRSHRGSACSWRPPRVDEARRPG